VIKKKLVEGLVVALALTAATIPLAGVSAQDPLVLDHVVISPESATIQKEGTQQFTATAYDAFNTELAGIAFSWEVAAGGGTINASTGLFTAGDAAGTFTDTVVVTATQGSVTVTADATVTVESVVSETNPSVPAGWTKGNKIGWGGASVPPGFSKGNKKGWGGESLPPGLMKKK